MSELSAPLTAGPTPQGAPAVEGGENPLAPQGVACQRVLRRLAAAPVPWLHEEAAKRMAERLGLVRYQPQRVINWEAAIGGGVVQLGAAYPKAQHVQVQSLAAQSGGAEAGTGAQRPWWQRVLGPGKPAPTVAPGDLQPESAGLVWANMSLHWHPNPDALLGQWHRALKPEGFLMFSTLGPGSLQSLQALYGQQAWGPGFAPFVDMHDWGDALVRAGFAEPVMDQETLNLSWSSPQAALSELRQWGGNVHRARQAGLRTPRWRHALEQALAQRAGQANEGGRVNLALELVYGHAFKPEPRAKVATQTEVSLEAMRGMLARRR